MIPAFTIGILGGCGRGRGMARYFEEVATHYLRTFPRVRFLFPVTTGQERAVVGHLLECRATYPGLEVAVMLTSRQWDGRRCSATDERTAACNRIIDAADCCEVLPESKTTLPQPKLYRRFIERCDHIIFNEHRAGWALAGLFHAQVVQSGVPIPVQYGFSSVKYTPFSVAFITIPRRNTRRASPTSNEPDSAYRQSACRRFSCANGSRRLRGKAAVI